jgi:patatin-related protein
MGKSYDCGLAAAGVFDTRLASYERARPLAVQEAFMGTPAAMHETRIGLVMYGGVSLAVYENGVSQEMFRAVHGEGVYDLVRRLRGTNIVVDVISGTSAGGINGVLLAFALANGGEFAPSAELWRKHGDILSLLRQANDPSTASVLNSEGEFHTQLVRGLRALLPRARGRERPLRCPEIDLYVTGTNVRGAVFTTCDDLGHPVDVKDHRTIFKLSFRDGRKNEFGWDDHLPEVQMTDRIEALATLARITSCFPVAFAPVMVNPVFTPPPRDDPRQIDFLLTRWGKLSAPCAFLDGGVLDNKPFSYTIDGVFSRVADGPVNRIMFYVEPNPERFPANAQGTPLAQPNVLEAAIDALITVPGYESIGADLRSIAERNTRLSHYQEVRSALDYLEAPADHHHLTLASLHERDSTRGRMYCQSRLVQLRTRAVEVILQRDPGASARTQHVNHHAARILAESFNEWDGEGAATLDEFDIYFRARRTVHLIYAVRELLFGARAGELGERERNYRELLWRLNELSQMQEMVRSTMEQTAQRFEFDLQPLREAKHAAVDLATGYWVKVQNLMRGVLAWAPDRFPLTQLLDAPEKDANVCAERRAAFYRALKTQAQALPTRGALEERAAAPNLLHELDRLEAALVERFTPERERDPIYVEFARFLWIDANLFPIEQSGDIVAKDVLRTVRISPLDAQRGYGVGKSVADKLCGDMLGHFAGFLKRSWRSNDIMWGRLDAVSQLLECLLPVDTLLEIPTEALRALDLERTFPTAAHEDLQRLAARLQELATTRAPAAAQAFLEEVIDVAQGEILHEEVPRVIQDAIDQQREWNSYSLAPSPPRLPYDVRSGRWTIGVRQLDRAIVDYASSQLLGAREQRPSVWPRFFRTAPYRVGEEEFPGDIPAPVLLEIGARLALVLRTCILGVFPEAMRTKIAGNALYRFGLDYPLRLLYAIARFQRSAPEFARVMVAIFATVCVVLLIVTAIHYEKLLDGVQSFLAFVFLPGVVLLALAMTGLSPLARFIGHWAWKAVVFVFAFAACSLVIGTVLLALAVVSDIMTPQSVAATFGGGPLARFAPWAQWVLAHATDVVVWVLAFIAGAFGALFGPRFRRRWLAWRSKRALQAARKLLAVRKPA